MEAQSRRKRVLLDETAGNVSLGNIFQRTVGKHRSLWLLVIEKMFGLPPPSSEGPSRCRCPAAPGIARQSCCKCPSPALGTPLRGCLSVCLST